MMRRTALALVPLAGLLAGCDAQHPTVSELEAVPGAMSSYPGSVAIGGHGAVKGEHTLWSSSPAMILGTFCAPASQPEVTRWFASELGRDGWETVPNPVGTTDNDVAATEEWRRGRRTFTLELMTPASVRRLSAANSRRCSAGYRVVVQ